MRRTGGPATDDFSDADVITKLGDLPDKCVVMERVIKPRIHLNRIRLATRWKFATMASR
jgi:hypothetical protein